MHHQKNCNCCRFKLYVCIMLKNHCNINKHTSRKILFTFRKYSYYYVYAAYITCIKQTTLK